MALDYSRTQEASGTFTVYCKSDLNLISLHFINTCSCRLVMRKLNSVTKFSELTVAEKCCTQQGEL